MGDDRTKTAPDSRGTKPRVVDLQTATAGNRAKAESARAAPPERRSSPTAESLAGTRSPAAADELGKVLSGRFTLLRLLGEGGMGLVYEAQDEQLDRRVAIKIIRADCARVEHYLTRFRRELEVTSLLRHPSTVRVFEHGETDDGRPYMIMELLTGRSLVKRIEEGPLPEMEALQYARQIAESLSEAHAHGIFHRDLKPENVFIEQVGMTTLVKVLDFGIAGGTDAVRLTQAGEVFGTPQYMSPEQCNGQELDPRTDIYSLGCILYEMIEGSPPFAAPTAMATMLKHVRTKAPQPTRASPETARIILTALRKDRTRRIQTASRFAALLGEAMGTLRQGAAAPEPTSPRRAVTQPVSLEPTFPTTISIPPSVERRGPIVAIGLGGLALTLVLGLLFGGTTARPTGDGIDPNPLVIDESTKLFNRPLIQTDVPGTTVFVDGEAQGMTPCEIKVPVGDGRSHEIRVGKPGHADAVVYWEPRTISEAPPPLPALRKIP